MCIYTVGSLWGAWTSVLIIEVSTFCNVFFGINPLPDYMNEIEMYILQDITIRML